MCRFWGPADADPVPVGPVRGSSPAARRIAVAGRVSGAARGDQLAATIGGRRDPAKVRVLNIDRVVSPGNRYQREVNGKLCRFDGIHFAIYCSELVAPDVLSAVRGMIPSPTFDRR